jgi:hypothetical protein
MSPSINSLVESAERFLSDEAVLMHRRAIGAATSTDEGQLFERHASLADAEVLPFLSERLAQTTDTTKHLRLQSFLRFVGRFTLNRAQATSRAALTQALLNRQVEVGPMQMTLATAAQFGHRQENTQTRQALASQLSEVLVTLKAQCESLADTQAQWAASTAFSPAAHELKGSTAIAADAYQDVLQYALRRTDAALSLRQATWFDGLHAVEGLSYAQPLSVEGLLSVCTRTLSELGFDPYAQGRIAVERAPAAPHTSAAVFAVGVPHDVRLVLRALPGLLSTAGWLSSWGVAIFTANVSSTLPFVERALGDNAAAVAFGRLFRLLLVDEQWLKRHFKMSSSNAREVARLAALGALLELRQSEVTLSTQREWAARGAFPTMLEDFAERASAALLLTVAPGFGVLIPSAHEASAQLSAVPLEMAWWSHLREHFNEDWWRNPAAGRFLKTIAEGGTLESASTRVADFKMDDGFGAAMKRLQATLSA